MTPNYKKTSKSHEKMMSNLQKTGPKLQKVDHFTRTNMSPLTFFSCCVCHDTQNAQPLTFYSCCVDECTQKLTKTRILNPNITLLVLFLFVTLFYFVEPACINPNITLFDCCSRG